MKPLSRNELAHRIARELPRRSYVNLGIGMPGLVSHFVTPEQDVVLQSENGVLNYRGIGDGEEPDLDCIDASKRPVTVCPGGCFMDVVASFGLMRGGHLDVAVLGAFEVSRSGDLANWSTGADDDVPGVGGAMDLACGAKSIWAMMEHVTRDGRPKLVDVCSYPLTAPKVVSKIFTDLAVIDVVSSGLIVREMVLGLDRSTLQARTGARLTFADEITLLDGGPATGFPLAEASGVPRP